MERLTQISVHELIEHHQYNIGDAIRMILSKRLLLNPSKITIMDIYQEPDYLAYGVVFEDGK